MLRIKFTRKGDEILIGPYNIQKTTDLRTGRGHYFFCLARFSRRVETLSSHSIRPGLDIMYVSLSSSPYTREEPLPFMDIPCRPRSTSTTVLHAIWTNVVHGNGILCPPTDNSLLVCGHDDIETYMISKVLTFQRSVAMSVGHQ